MPLRWILPPEQDEKTIANFASELDVSPFVAGLLYARGMTSLDTAEQFLNPFLKTLSDPFLLPDMKAAATRIFAAADAGEKVALYGDYDVDGVTSLTILAEMLTAYGIEVGCFLPSRMAEGYGLSSDGVERCLEEHNPRLLIAVDCGTASAKEIAGITAKGIDVLVFDHHECKDELPQCTAVVNPKRGDDFTYLCSAGLVFKVCHALLKTRKIDGFDLRDSLDLVAIGTVADLVPLEGENRIFVRAGLPRVLCSKRPGVRALMEVSGVKNSLSSRDIGFRLGPRLNASGRMDSAGQSLDLLMTADRVKAQSLARALDEHNRNRQATERKIQLEAEAQLKESFDAASDAAIVVGARDWHPGVLGIVASRLMRTHYRPTIVIGFDDSGSGKGSGRSIEGLSLVDAMGKCEALLEQFGGHEMAAGVSIKEENFSKFVSEFRMVAAATLTGEQLQPFLRIDAELPLEEVDIDLLGEHELLEPFGMDNPQPVFFARHVTPAFEPRVLKERHLKFQFAYGQREVDAIFFGGAENDLPEPPWDIAFLVERNEFRGRVSAQIQVKAIRKSS